MKIDIIGATQRQTINFDDYPVGIKVKIADKRTNIIISEMVKSLVVIALNSTEYWIN